ncbi:hypothetical protein DFH27DRAFT_53117 [Peziza echinospora]|nr:hypothetical protein DFH27DRAFT_53117 [Peziza echinospora]
MQIDRYLIMIMLMIRGVKRFFYLYIFCCTCVGGFYFFRIMIYLDLRIDILKLCHPGAFSLLFSFLTLISIHTLIACSQSSSLAMALNSLFSI